jgi:hypothetical protein
VVTWIDITGDLSGYRLPPGSTPQVAIYTQHARAVAIIRRILLRMMSWMNYIV